MLYRLPIERLSHLHVDDEAHQRMYVESCVFKAVAELLGKDPWDLAPTGSTTSDARRRPRIAPFRKTGRHAAAEAQRRRVGRELRNGAMTRPRRARGRGRALGAVSA